MSATTQPGAVSPPPVRGRTRRLRHGVPVEPIGLRLLKGLALLVLCAVVVLPFVGVLATSLAGREQIAQSGGLVLWPSQPTLEAYRSIFAGGVVTQALQVSLVVTIGGTLLSLAATCLVAYALAQRELFGKKVILMIFLISMLFSPGMIPTYLTVRQVGLLDSLWALILPTMVSAFNVVVMRAFFMNLPSELTESAQIDGASEFRVFTRIVLPLSKAVLAVIGLFYAVGYWNAFFNALLYINDATKWPMQLVLRTYVVNDVQMGSAELGSEVVPPQPAIQMAILVISIVPILIIYPFLQKHFAKGVLTGAVKG
ncbi:carbohydrate ABC transporter permease [Desertihabitans aurantiacus]|uniref:carbohydrate ABC transporter permease n=1 Tax=Desertihabitans aurantiacus TaxID=2282477 RepID=UPI000DF8530C|nr:carbohydrate ABC transporter permease [Desertihabitans aurantiacus]